MASKLNTYFQTFKTDKLGQILMTGILDVQAYNKVNVEIIQWPHAPVSMTVSCMMGKLSGSTLAQTVGAISAWNRRHHTHVRGGWARVQPGTDWWDTEN